MKIIFAQGNPEKRFENTRHNLGFLVIDELAKQASAEWTEKSKFRSLIAETELFGEKVILVKPTTFYNDTGLAARMLIDFYKITPAEDLLVIHDDLSLPFGTIRVRSRGSDAGNNGIKSLNAHVGEDYTRIRVGVWNELRDRMDDVSFVLGKFSAGEHAELPKIIELLNPMVKAFVKNSLDSQSASLDK